MSYRNPAEIDAETPQDVRSAVCAQLEDLAPRLRELVEASGRQIRNAVLQDFLEETGDLDEASAKLTEWENGDDRAAVERLFGLGAALEQAALKVAAIHPAG